MKPGNKLVLGMGSEILSDEGIGFRITKAIEASGELAGFDFNTSYTGGLDLLEFVKNYDEVYIIDGIKTINGKPGHIYIYDNENYEETLNISNTHDISFTEMLEFSEYLYSNMPYKIVVFAIEVQNVLEISSKLSHKLQLEFNNILHKIRKSIKCISENMEHENINTKIINDYEQ